MVEFLHNFNLWFYSIFLIGPLILCGLYFTVRTRAVQIRMLGRTCRLLTDGNEGKKGKHFSNFQSFVMAMAGRVGSGNIAGVAIALTVGGAGAIFWMWITALLGAATGFVESTLAQIYHKQDKNSYIGGTAYYIRDGLHCKWLAVLAAVIITITFSLGFNSVQSNTLGLAFKAQFGWSPVIVGICVTLLTAAVIMGGASRIAGVTSVLVPFMSIGYILLAIIVVAMNIDRVPEVFCQIFRSAFGLEQISGGLLGGTIMQGVRRGLFSNEAGIGSIPQAAAAAKAGHPVQQGLLQSLGVLVDTLLICSCTALIILFSGIDISGQETGIELAQSALASQLGSFGSLFITIALFFFVFSSLIALYYYGEANIKFLTGSRTTLTIFRIIVLAVIMLGFVSSLNLVWELTDTLMGFCAIVNITAIIILFPKVSKSLKDYESS